MRIANILAGIAALLWLGDAALGRGQANSVASRHLTGYPSLVQIDWYIVWPLCVAMGVLGVAWLCNGLQRWPRLLGSIAVISIFVLLPYFALSSGGI